MQNKNYLLAIAMMVATIVGGGLFALPYAFAVAGFWPTMIVFIGLAVVSVIIMLMFGEVVLRTKGTHHQAVGYAEKYLGKKGKVMMLLVTMASGYGGLLIYTIGVGDFMHRLFDHTVFESELVWGLIFFAVAALFVILGVKSIARLDFGLLFVFIGIVVAVFVLAIPEWGPENFVYANIERVLFPFGIIIFSLMGSSAIPLLDDMLIGKKRKLKGVIIWGSVIAILISLVFALAVFGMGGVETTDDALGTVQVHLPTYVSFFMGIFGIIAMGTSFLTTGVVLREIFEYDYKIKRVLALFLVLSVPLVLFLLNIAGFASAIGFVGSITGGLGAILFILMYRRARVKSEKEPEYKVRFSPAIQVTLIIVYIIAMLYEIYALIF
ncbi:aromatic amino acid transport family protein [Patescibacteria group bacterium]